MKKIAFLLSFVGCVLTAFSQEFIFDMASVRQLKASDLADGITAYNLQSPPFDMGSIVEVHFVGNKLLALEKIADNSYFNVLTFSRTGEYLGQFGESNRISPNVSRLSYDELNERVYTYCKDGLREYDTDGNLLNYVADKSIEYVNRHGYWSLKTSVKNGRAEVELLLSPKSGKKSRSLSKYKYHLPQHLVDMNVAMFPTVWIGDVAGETYVSTSTRSEIFVFDGNKLQPKYSYRFVGAQNFIDSITNWFSVSGDMVLLSINGNVCYYSFYHMMKEKKTLGVAYRYSPQGLLKQGIRDDILNTGNFSLQTNEGVHYFLKQGANRLVVYVLNKRGKI